MKRFTLGSSSIGEIFAKAVKEGNEDLVREPNLKDYKAR